MEEERVGVMGVNKDEDGDDFDVVDIVIRWRIEGGEL